MNERKQLSLCMITNNDEKHLSDCMQDLKEIADEVIIVDIGSNDKTIEIAERAGACVHQMKWGNSFSEAKNLCLDHAKGRWILFLQANETISAQQLKEIKPLLNNPNTEGYLLRIDFVSEGYGISSPLQSLRLFRNRKEYRYKYKSFEMIPDELITNINDTYIRVMHRYGSALSWEQNMRILLLQEDIIEHPEDGYLQYIHGIELLNQQKYEESIICFQKARINLNCGYLFAPHLYKCLSWALLYLNRYEEALIILDEGISSFSFYTDLLVLRGELHRQLKQYGKAIQDLKSCLKIREQPNSMVPGPEIDNSVILETLGEVQEQIFNFPQALACYRQAYGLNNTNHDILSKIDELTKIIDLPEVQENLMNTSELEGMKCVKWSKNFIAKSEEWIYRLEGIDEIADAAVALASRTQVKPSKTLLDFYKSLSINESNTENSASKDGNTELTCSEVHGKIGDFYVQAQKNDEALSAYLRALQWDPQNEHAQEELFKIFKNNSGRFHDFLEKKAWILEGNLFHHKQEFVNYIHGIISFKSEQFEQALTFFSQIVDDETSYPIALAFIISSLRLEGRNTEAENRLGENINIAEVLLFHFNICKSYALCKLGESERKYPYSDLIQREKERIRNRNLI